MNIWAATRLQGFGIICQAFGAITSSIVANVKMLA
jgi:hypothetical protein